MAADSDPEPKVTVFGYIDGKEIHEIFLDNGSISCSILTYGCIIRTLNVPDAAGNMMDVVLGYDDLDSYVRNSGRLGAVIGRYANRISGGRFVLDGHTIELSVNRPPNHIHGGFSGFDKKVWNIIRCDSSSVTLGYHSKDGEEGYPGNLEVHITCTLSDHSLIIDYSAESDKDTICSLTNHSYFNLSGSNGIDDHSVQINAGRFVPMDGDMIPLGILSDVNGSNDLRGLTSLDPDAAFDVCYILDRNDCALCRSGTTGIEMSVSTDMPAMQFYTADGLSERQGKKGMLIGKRSGICFETEFLPDAPNNPAFGCCVLRKGERYGHRTEFSFRTL